RSFCDWPFARWKVLPESACVIGARPAGAAATAGAHASASATTGEAIRLISTFIPTPGDRNARRAGQGRPSRALAFPVLSGRDVGAVDGRVLPEHLHLGDVHLAGACGRVAVGIVGWVFVLEAVVRGLARALVVRDDELDVRRHGVRTRVEVTQGQ